MTDFKKQQLKLIFKYFYIAYWEHQNKIAELRREHNKPTKLPSTGKRILFVGLFSILSGALLWFVHTNPYEWEIFNKTIIDTKSIISLTTLIITAPIAFIIWAFRDKNRLIELENARKDTNLKEFQQLQRWATGNIEGDKDNEDNEDNKIALQISALHSLRAYLKGEYGESFRRGAYEIFRATLATQHQKILTDSKENATSINVEIKKCPLTKQLNIIASEEWFNLLINHNFPTNTISLVGVDLKGTYLHHRTYGEKLDLNSANLQGADLIHARLQGADLRRAQLQGADLIDARLQEARLSFARLQGADLSDARLQGANLRSAQLQGADLRNAQLQGADLIDAQLQGADLDSANLQGARLIAAQLQGARLIAAQLQGARLIHAQLQGADLSDARLQGADLIDAQLQGADLNHAQLQGADLIHAQLQGANLRRAQLQGADLSDAQLQGARLSFARLQGADLSDARLQGADLSDAQLQGADLWDAQLQGADLNGAQLQGIYISGAFESLNFKQRIAQQIDKPTDENGLKQQYKALSDEEKEQLIAKLNKVKNLWTDEAIARIESASEKLELSGATTGTYNQKEANEWLK